MNDLINRARRVLGFWQEANVITPKSCEYMISIPMGMKPTKEEIADALKQLVENGITREGLQKAKAFLERKK